MKNKYYAIFGIVFLLLSLAGGMYLTNKNTENRSKAVSAGSCNCVITGHGTNAGGGTCNGTSCICGPGKSVKQNRCGEGGGGGSRGNVCSAGQTKCQENSAGKNTGYNCTCDTSIDDWSCTTFDTKACATDSVPVGVGTCDNGKGEVKVSGGCVSAAAGIAGFSARLVQCQGDTNSTGCSNTNIVRQSNNSVCFDVKYCGAQQIDVSIGGSDICYLHRNSNDCVTPPKPTNTPPKIPTATPTKKLTSTPTKIPTITKIPTATPTSRIMTNTPTPPIITNTPPAESPTPTPTTPYVSPTPTPTVGIYACGYTPCDNNGHQCASGLVCITANNSAQYCSRPEYVDTCKMNPGYAGCCTAPIAEGPSPTRIILPVSGVEFPAQALTIIGGIATLLGFLVLL